MKLFLTWLLGVPLLVTSMVIAQSLLSQEQEARARQSCSAQHNVHDVTPLIPKQGYGVSCERFSIQ